MYGDSNTLLLFQRAFAKALSSTENSGLEGTDNQSLSTAHLAFKNHSETHCLVSQTPQHKQDLVKTFQF